MKKIPCIAFFVFCFSFLVSSQDETGQYIRKGLFRSAGTFAAGTFLNSGNSAIYLQGTSEYYMHEKISIRGDGYYSISLNAGKNELYPQLFMNHQLLSGASYHFVTDSHLDFYLGAQTGIAISRFGFISNIDESPLPVKTILNPIASSTIGLNYYFQKWFHLFLETRYVYGAHIAHGGVFSLNELRFAFGLGWNLNFIRNKN